jgi:hypothetical protein
MNVSKSRRRAGGVLVAAALAACGGEGVTRAVVPDAGGGDAAAPVPDAAPIAADATPDSALAEIGLTIEAPVAGQWVNTRRFEVRGRFTGPAEAIDVNGVAAVLDADTYRAFVTLPPGPGLVTVTAGGTIATVDVTVDPVPPRIDLTTPLRGTWVSDLTSPLAFGVTDDNGLTGVYLNERRLPGAGPDFSLDAPLAPGLNVLTVRADDLAGNTARESDRRPRRTDAGSRGPHRRRVPRAPRPPRPCSGVGAEAARYVDDLDLRALSCPPRPFEAAGVHHSPSPTSATPTRTYRRARRPTPFQLRARRSTSRAVEVDVSITINEDPYPGDDLHAAAPRSDRRSSPRASSTARSGRASAISRSTSWTSASTSDGHPLLRRSRPAVRRTCSSSSSRSSRVRSRTNASPDCSIRRSPDSTASSTRPCSACPSG